MTISSQLLERYAKSFAVAFPEYDERQKLAMVAEVSGTAQIAGTPLDSWRDILHCAHAAGTLLQLVGAATALKPNNRAIWNLHGLLEGRATERMNVKKTVLVTFLFGLGALLLVWTNVVQTVVDSSELAPTTGATDEAAVVDPEAILAEPSSDTETIQAEAPTLSIIERQAPAPELQSPISGTTERASVSSRCGGERGSIVGYFYVGDGIDSVAGETHVMTTSAYVRGDYPRRENGWDFSVPAACALNPGDRVVLIDAPILVDGGKYWVALYGESLLSQ